MPGETPHPPARPDPALPTRRSRRRGGGPHDPRARRAALREKARVVREREQRRERGGTLLVRAGVLVGGIAVVTGAALGLVSVIGSAPPPAVPANAASDGVRVGAGLVAERSEPRPPGVAPVVDTTPAARDVADITIWVDFHCPACKEFELQNADYLEQLVDSGAATVQIHPVAITDSASGGTRYATRAAAAAMCVADASPDQFWQVTRDLFLAQPAPGRGGLTNDELAALVTSVEGITDEEAVVECVDDQRFARWVTAATKRALAGPLPSDDVDGLRGTPTVLVDGQLFDPTRYTFPEFVASVLGATYAAERATTTEAAATTDGGAR